MQRFVLWSLALVVVLTTGCVSTGYRSPFEGDVGVKASAALAANEIAVSVPEAYAVPHLYAAAEPEAPKKPIRGNSWEVGLMFPYWMYGDGTLYEPERDVSYDSALGFGVRGGYYITEASQIELALSQQEANTEGGLNSDVVVVELAYVHNFLFDAPVVPFVRGGIGAFFADVEPEAADDDGGPAIALGGGVKWFVIEHLVLRADLDITQAWPDNSDRDPDLRFTLGVAWYFG